MKLITDVKDDELFLSRLYDSAEVVSDLLEKTNILAIRQAQPIYTGKETEEEKNAKLRKQTKTNILAMAKALLKDNPKELLKVVESLVVLEKGEEPPHGVGMFNIITHLLDNEELMSFFTSMVRLGIEISKI